MVCVVRGCAKKEQEAERKEKLMEKEGGMDSKRQGVVEVMSPSQKEEVGICHTAS